MVKLLLIFLLAQSDFDQQFQDIQSGQVLAWARHTTGFNEDDEFKSVAVIPDDSGEDVIYAIVERTIDGTDYKYIEYFQPVDFGDQNDAYFVDGGGDIVDIWVGEIIGTPEVLGDYPTLRTTADQVDPGLTHTTAIANLTDLENMVNDRAGNYYLSGNIDASATSGGGYNGGAGWVAIGTVANPFTGTFDGAGFTITGLFINRTTDYVSLFGAIKGPAKIANVTLADVDIMGDDYVASLVSYANAFSVNEDVLIQNCHTTGIVKVTNGGTIYMGGLIARVRGKDTSDRCFIYDCSTTCEVNAEDYGTATQVTNLGGLAGSINHSTVINCFATGNVVGTDTGAIRVGGFVGYIDGGASIGSTEISYCYATGDVTGEEPTGGFAGNQTGLGFIRKCYATGDVTASGTDPDEVAGFAGGQEDTAEITDCYAWGNVTMEDSGTTTAGFVGQGAANNTIDNCYSIGLITSGGLQVGGFGGNIAENNVTNSYWDTQTSGQATSDGGTGQTTTWLKTNPNYPDAWDFDTIWFQDYTAAIEGVPGFADTVDVGYDRYEGEQLCVYADGIPLGTYTVVSGELDGLDESLYTTITAGINYYSTYESFPLVSPETNIHNVAIDFYNSLGCHVGVSRANSEDWLFSDDEFATRLDLVTEIKDAPFFWGTKRMPIIHIHEWDPIPLIVRNISTKLEIEID